MSPTHTMSKVEAPQIRLLAGMGVEGDAHAGATVKHRSRVRVDPTAPNLRQVHVLHEELLDELRRQGFAVASGVMGENITTRGPPLLELPRDTHLLMGPDAVVRVTGLRNPCTQLDGIQDGLMRAVLARDAEGRLVRKAGVMGVVVCGGIVRPGDQVVAELPNPPHHPLEPV